MITIDEKVIYPTVSLFLFDLLQGLGETDTTISGTPASTADRTKWFYRKIYDDDVKKSALLKQRELVNHPFNELHPDPSHNEPFEGLADGYYYPVQLDDTYALLVDYSGELDQNNQENHVPQDLADLTKNPFHDRQKEIIKRLHGEAFTLGQTWLLRATLTKPEQQPEEIAKRCYQQTFPAADWKTDYLGYGKLLGGDLYELWSYPRAVNEPATAIAASQHVLIWLLPPSQKPQDTLNKEIATTYKDLIRLLHYRHKIWAAYAESQMTTTQLKAEVTDINQIANLVRSSQSALMPSLKSTAIVKSTSSTISQWEHSANVKTHLDRLQSSLVDTLTHFDTYTNGLQQLSDRGRTIETNRANYREQSQIIATKYPDSDLKFLDEFNGDRHANRYAHQIAADYAVLAPRLNYLEKLNQTIDNTIRIEQTKSSIEQTRIDRFNGQMFAVVGVGFSATQIATTALNAHRPAPSQSKENIIYGLFIGIFASLIAIILIRRFNLFNLRHR